MPWNAKRRGAIPLVLLVTSAGFVLSVLAYLAIGQWQQQAAAQEFGEIARFHQHAFQRSLDDVVELTQSAGRLFNSSNWVTRKEFQRFVAEPIDEQPALLGVFCVPCVAGDKKSEWTRRADEEGLTGFRLRERDSEGQLRPADSREKYFPIVYFEPAE
mgnify:FL=1